MKHTRRKILDINVDYGYTMDQVVKRIETEIQKKDGTHLVATTSPYFIMAAQKDKEFKKAINNSLLSIPDGVGVLFANYYLNKASTIKRDKLFPVKALFGGISTGLIEGYLKKKELGEQLTGVELTERLFKLADENRYTIFLLGGRRRDSQGNQLDDGNYDMATAAANVMLKRYPNVRIVGSTSAFSRQEGDDAKTLKYIHDCMSRSGVTHVDILLVAYNPVGQEKWIQRNAKDIPATISVGIGRTFDYITNEMSLPHPLYEKLHIAWLYPLLVQPWRFKRVCLSFPIFPLKVYFDSIKSR